MDTSGSRAADEQSDGSCIDRFNAGVPNIARVYNYWLGGKDNFAADREVGDIALRNDPLRAWSVRANRAFLARAVRFLALEAGIRQFLDIGTGIPAANNTHEVAQAAAKDCRIVYVDNDPVVLSHARALLRSAPEGRCAYIDADARDPATILREAARTLDFAEPVAIMLIAIMHCVPDSADPYGVVNLLMDSVPRGSYLALSHPASDINTEIRSTVNREMNKVLATPTTLRNRDQVGAFFDGLDLLDPGVVLVSQWRPDTDIEKRMPTSVWGGVARKMLAPGGTMKRTAAVALLALLTLLAAACGSSTPSSSPPSSSSTSLEKTTITVGQLPVVDNAPFQIALKNGYFAQQGLKVNVVTVLQSTQSVPDLLRGTVDIIGGNYTSYIEGDSRGTFHIDVIGMALNCVPNDFEVLTLPGSGITSAKDLANKTVAVNLTNNIQTLTLNAILKADGVSGQPHYVAIPFPEMGAALKAHRVSAISVVEPYITANEKTDGAVPVTSQCIAPVANYPVSGYFATASWVKANPNTLRAFQTALNKGQAYADANPAAVRSILPTYTKITAAEAQKVVLGDFPASIDTAQLQQLANLMSSEGMISSPLQMSTIVAP